LRWGRSTSFAGRIRIPCLSNTCEAACRSCSLWHQKRVPGCARPGGQSLPMRADQFRRQCV
jgi:hypothetical protein